MKNFRTNYFFSFWNYHKGWLIKGFTASGVLITNFWLAESPQPFASLLTKDYFVPRWPCCFGPCFWQKRRFSSVSTQQSRLLRWSLVCGNTSSKKPTARWFSVNASTRSSSWTSTVPEKWPFSKTTWWDKMPEAFLNTDGCWGLVSNPIYEKTLLNALH